MNSYRELGKKLELCAKKQMGKALFAFFMLSMLQTVIMSIFMAPVLLSAGTDKATVSGMAGAAVLLYAGFVFILVLQYGYHVLIVRLVRGEFVTVGYLFAGFRDRRRVVSAALLYAMGLAVSLVICQIVAFFFNKKLKNILESFGFPVLVLCIFAVFTVLSVFLLVRFTFVWLCLYDVPSSRVIAAFKKSAELLRQRSVRLIGFVLYAGGRRLIVAVILFIVSMIVPDTKGSAAAFLFFLLEFAYFVAAYSAVVRMFMALPIFYDSITGGPIAVEGPSSVHPAELPEPPVE